MKLTLPMAALLVIILISITGCASQPVVNSEKIVFASGFETPQPWRSQIYIMDSDGSNLKRLTNNTANDSFPVFSPDGRKIVFESDRDGNEEIYVMNADGSNQTRLTINTAIDTFPQWLPDGKRISYVSDRDRTRGKMRIYIMNADGTNQVRLSKDSFYEGQHSWSPDGTRVAFTYRGDYQDISSMDSAYEHISCMNADGTDVIRLTSSMSCNEDFPAWSPDGKKVAFRGYSDEVKSPDSQATAAFDFYEIYVMNADGSNQVNLTNNLKADEWPAWSPDSQKIVFASKRDCTNNVDEIYVMNADGSNVKRLTNTHCTGVACPSWR